MRRARPRSRGPADRTEHGRARTLRAARTGSRLHASAARALPRHRRVLVSLRVLGLHEATVVDRVDQRARVGRLLLSGPWPHSRRPGREPRARARAGRPSGIARPIVSHDLGVLVVLHGTLPVAGEPRALQRRPRRRGALASGDGRNGRHDPLDRASRPVGNGHARRRVEFPAPGPHRARAGNRSAGATIRRGTHLALQPCLRHALCRPGSGAGGGTGHSAARTATSSHCRATGPARADEP